jgi:hypothetical protein
MHADFITVVSGLPRSGTSLMMQMLRAGGLPALTDEQRSADADNPRGYYEFEAVKKLKEDASWVGNARGQAVKVISMLLYDLPPSHPYRVVFMVRDPDEILASQKQMLKRRGTPAPGADDEAMKRHFEAHLQKVRAWLAERPNIRVHYCDYRELLRAPVEPVRRLAEFLGGGLDQRAMVEAVDQSLYRNRAAAGPGSTPGR